MAANLNLGDGTGGLEFDEVQCREAGQALDNVHNGALRHVGPGVGVPLAIDEFDAASVNRRLICLSHLEFRYGRARPWLRRICSFCDFHQPHYNGYVVGSDRPLHL
jgi:hypothetical protein